MAVLELVLRQKQEGSALKQAAKDLGGLEKAASALKSGLAGMAVMGAAKAAVDLAKLGADAERADRAFTNLSGGAGGATANLAAMRDATRGALSEMDMMASASKLMAMGLADNADELKRTSEMAVVLGQAFGKDSKSAIEEWALMLANQSIPRLDTFGISSGQVRERIEELTKTVKGMTREQAFMQAVMEEGKTSMERLGGPVDDSALAFERLEAKVTNLKVAVGEKLAPVLGGAIDTFMLLSEWSDKIAEATEQQKAALAETTETYEDYVTGVKAAYYAQKKVVEVLEDGTVAEKTYTEWGGEVVKVGEAMTRQAYLSARARGDDRREIYDWTEAVHAAAWAGRDLAEATADDRRKMIDFSDVVDNLTSMGLTNLSTFISGTLGPTMEEFVIKQDGLKTKVGELVEKIEILEAKRWLTPAQKEELEGLRGELEDTNEAIDGNAKAHEDATRRILFSLLQQRAGVDGVSQDELALMNTVARAWGLIDQDTYDAVQAIDGYLGELARTGGENIDQVMQSVIGLDSWLKQLPSEKRIKIVLETIGSVPPEFLQQQAAAGRGSGVPEYQTGAWNIPARQLAVLHPGEMVLPPGPAEALRQQTINQQQYHYNVTVGSYLNWQQRGALFDQVGLLGRV